jgi:hypothetical protein
MTSFIIIVVIALFIVSIGFTWYRLEAFEDVERVIICVAGILISWGITNMLFSISSNGIDYVNIEVENEISKILILVFTPINGIAFMPFVAKIMSQLKFDEIERKEAVKNGVILFAILAVVFYIEIRYLSYIQLGILNIANNI